MELPNQGKSLHNCILQQYVSQASFFWTRSFKLLCCLDHSLHLTEHGCMSHPLPLSSNHRLEALLHQGLFLHTAVGFCYGENPLACAQSKQDMTRTSSCMQREENKVMGHRLKVNKKIIFSYTCGRFLTQKMIPPARERLSKKHHVKETQTAV